MIEFDIFVKPVTLGCVGSSVRAVLGPDIEFYRRGDTICIPGSSLKGALRSSASRVARVYGFESCDEVRPEHMKPCDVCKLFGGPGGLPSLLVGDLEPVEQTQRIIITRVKINDKSLRAEEGGLYTQEHVLFSEFRGKVIILNPEKRLLGLLLLAIAELRLDRVGRNTVLDVRLERTESLQAEIEPRWMELLEGLKKWLWEGKV
jgi:CRISPR/Cas system CSM-associated protein Csm3 (group 7 of RAMP superfamily)